MLGNKGIRKLITASTLVAVWTVYSMVALAAPGTSTAEITVTGQVTVNGQAAISNSTIPPDNEANPKLGNLCSFCSGSSLSLSAVASVPFCPFTPS